MNSLTTSNASLDLVHKSLKADKTELSSEEQNQTASMAVKESSDDLYSPKQRLLLTLCISFSFCISSIQLNMTGPTLLHMGYLLKMDITVMSLTFTFEWCGFLVGCMLCGFVYEKYNEEFQFSVINILVGIATIICPWFPVVSGFFASKILQSIGIGYQQTICITHFLKLWEGHGWKNVIFSLFKAMHPTGALVQT